MNIKEFVEIMRMQRVGVLYAHLMEKPHAGAQFIFEHRQVDHFGRHMASSLHGVISMVVIPELGAWMRRRPLSGS